MIYFAREDKKNHLRCLGCWTINNLTQIQSEYHALPKNEYALDASDITTLDTAGAWFLNSITEHAKPNQLRKEFLPLFNLVKQQGKLALAPKLDHLNFISHLGKDTILFLKQFKAYLFFLGELTYTNFSLFLKPSHWRGPLVANTIYKTGYQALGIIALLSFMIGVVIAYQMGNQLRNYGANVFIVDLLGLSILREFGPLLTAIIIAGRTGSAFTAQLGIMKINQEIDALRTIGVSPMELLVMPRCWGLIISLPLLTIWADLFGILGGMLMANHMLSVEPFEFINRFQNQIPLRNLIIGLGKAPIFALIISSIACFEGMQVKGSSESIGAHTTRSVVLTIFFIIIVDAIFSILFSWFKL